MIKKYFKGEEKQIFEAVWQYLLDHSDLTPEGTLFVKFHCKDKDGFMASVVSRMKGVTREGGWKEKVLGERRSLVLSRADRQSALETLENGVE